MSEEIQIPILIYPHRVTNANGRPSHLSMSNNLFMPFGWVLPTDAVVDYCGILVTPIPSWIAGTPNGKVYVYWATASTDTTNQLKLQVKCQDKTPDSFSLDHSSWDDELSFLDASVGQYVLNRASVSLSAATQSSGSQLVFVFRRDKPGDSGDTLAATCYLLQAHYAADKTT